MFDTQLIIRKARMGDKDFIAHSLDLFIDFVEVFRSVLIFLMQKDERDNKKKQREDEGDALLIVHLRTSPMPVGRST